MKTKQTIWMGVAVATVGILSLSAIALAESKRYKLESDGNERVTKDLGSRAYKVELVKRLSSKPCVRGIGYGLNNGRLWVDNGCRAEFKVSFRGNDWDDNNNGWDDRDRDDNRNKNKNKNKGKGWGNSKDWGDNNGAPGKRSYTIRVESQDGEYREQSIPAGRPVTLSRQLSSKPCQAGVSWGVKYNRVWVKNGCRAEFRVGGG